MPEKYKRESRQDAYQSYVTDMLWAPANQKVFKDVKRFSELLPLDKPHGGRRKPANEILQNLIEHGKRKGGQ
ncbi:hypothetical protein LJC49_07130 [Ruminococcaceae bacterium OttesenSCG-928-I18]|nr:hypothetical protein [Ruminococcaceae bacterium OttesenSCG-928-I18]